MDDRYSFDISLLTFIFLNFFSFAFFPFLIFGHRHLMSQLWLASSGFLLRSKWSLQRRGIAHMPSNDADDGQYIPQEKHHILIVCHRLGAQFKHNRKSKTRSWTGSSEWVLIFTTFSLFFSAFIRQSLVPIRIKSVTIYDTCYCIAMDRHKDRKSEKNTKNDAEKKQQNPIVFFFLRCRDHEFLSVLNFCICYLCHFVDGTKWNEQRKKTESGIILYSCWRLSGAKGLTCDTAHTNGINLNGFAIVCT